MQERLGQRGQQVLLVGEVAVEHRGDLPAADVMSASVVP